MWGEHSKKRKNNSDVSDKELERKLKNALNNKDVVAFKRLLKGGVDVNATYWFQSTLLHEATQMDNEQFVEILLKADANVDPWNENGRTPLHIAARSGNIAIVNMLLQNGADVNGRIKCQSANPSSSTESGQTPLHVALWRGRDEVIKQLLESGADVNALDQDGWLAIHWASKLNYVKILKEVIAIGSFIDKPTTTVDRTPLIQSLINSNSESAQVLLLHGVDVNRSFQGKSAFQFLLDDKHIPAKRKIEMVELFLDCGLCNKTFIHYKEQLKKLEDQSESMGIRKLSGNPVLDLTCLCRIQIRKQIKQCSLGKSIYLHLQKLHLPKILLEFLTFSDHYQHCYDL